MRLEKFNILLIVLLTSLTTALSAAVNTQYSATVCGTANYLFGCTPLTASAEKSNTLGDSTVHLKLIVAEPQNTAYTATIKPGETYLFGCQKLTAAGETSNTVQQAGCECDSTVHLTLKVLPALKDTAVQYSATINEGETYLFGCAQLTKDTVCFDTLHLAGRDSVTVLTLKVTPALKDTAVQYSATINEGETYLFGCLQLTKDTVCFDTLHLAGRDSVTVLKLKVTPALKDTAVQYSATINEGETYLFGCLQLTKDTVCFDTLHLAGRDSVTVLTLKVTPLAKDTAVQYEAQIKQGETYLFGCKQFTTDTTYADTLHLENRDSVTVLILTVVPDCPATIVVGDTVATICESELPFLWHGLSLKGDTTMCDDTLRNVTAAGCDSIVRLTLTVKPHAEGKKTITGCDQVVFKGITYTAYATVLDTVSGGAANGCDSIVTVTIIVKSHAVGKDTVTSCDSVVFKGITYKADATVYDTISGGAANGCDSIVTVAVIVKPHAVGLYEIADCDSVVYKGVTYKADATLYDTIPGGAANGCDSIVTIAITVKAPAVGVDEIAGCDSVVYKGVTYKADATVYDTISGGAVSGCDSIVTVTITVKPHAVGTDAITGCDSVVYKGVTYKADATVYDTISGGVASGCDSIVTVTITVNAHAVGVDAIESCDSAIFKGVTYKADATVYDTISGGAAGGCDSIVTVTIKILKSASSMEADTVCNLYTWHGVEYHESGIYRDTLVGQAANGCDSVCVLNLTIKVPYETALTLIHKFGDRLLMIHRHEINEMPGWHLDSLDTEHPEYVEWHQINPNTNVDSIVGHGYTYSLPSGDPLPAGYTYYAYIEIPGADTGGECGSKGATMHYTIPSHAQTPALMPSLARPGEEIRVINLNPTTPTTIRVFSADGVLHTTYNVTDVETYTIKADYNAGFYMVEVLSDGYKSTLRYIVQ